MKSTLTLAILTAVLFISAFPAQAKQLVFRAGREGESLRWYILSQRSLEPHPQQNPPAKLYKVILEVQEQVEQQRPRMPGQSPFQSGKPLFIKRTYQTSQWVNCSIQIPFVARPSFGQPTDLQVEYLNPAESAPGSSRYYNLYWAVCHNIWQTNSGLWSGDPAYANLLQQQSSRQLAQKLGYPSVLTFRSATVPAQTLLGIHAPQQP
jgi:hypothetical protein